MKKSWLELKLDRQINSVSKYLNTRTTVDGIVFDSKKEAHRYGELKLMERANQIRKALNTKKTKVKKTRVKVDISKKDVKEKWEEEFMKRINILGPNILKDFINDLIIQSRKEMIEEIFEFLSDHYWDTLDDNIVKSHLKSCKEMYLKEMEGK